MYPFRLLSPALLALTIVAAPSFASAQTFSDGQRGEIETIVKNYLVSLGVPADRVHTISYGKARPVCAESTEACWARNRRAVTVIAPGGATS